MISLSNVAPKPSKFIETLFARSLSCLLLSVSQHGRYDRVLTAKYSAHSTQEGSEGSVDLKEEDPEIVEKVLRFLYAGTYNGGCSCGGDITMADIAGISYHILLHLSTYRYIDSPKVYQKSQQEPGEALQSDVRVYVLAEYLGVEALRLQALGNCTHQLNHHFHAAKLVEPISIALSNTKSDDDGLRQQVLRSCVAKSAMVKTCAELEQVLTDQEPLAWSLLLEAQKRQDDLLRELVASTVEASAASTDLKHRTKDLERAHDNLRATVKLVNATKGCRNETCDKDFGAALETYANGYIKGLRCKRCKCRHLIT